MNKVSFIFFLSVSLLLLTSFIIKNPDNKQIEGKNNTILWISTRKLTWSDFQGTPDSISKHEAHTIVTITANNSLRTAERLEFNICNNFLINESWTRNRNSNNLLKHEQLHFDISELITRKIRKSYSVIVSSDLHETSILLKEITKKYNIELDSLNNSYDTETNHGLIKDKQKEWEVKIANELKALNAYSNVKVVIKRVKK